MGSFSIGQCVSAKPFSRIHVLSDLHLEAGEYEIPPDLDFDILVAAGDIGPIPQSIEWLARIGKPVVYVLGNHEHYWVSTSKHLPRCGQRRKERKFMFLSVVLP